MAKKKARSRKKAPKRKAAKRCACKKSPKLENMKLTTLRTKAKQIDSAIAKKTGKLGVTKRSRGSRRASSEFHGPIHRPHVGAHEFSD